MASASIQVTEPFLSQVERVREEMRANFLRSHQILQQREAALMSELDQLKANYRVEKIKEQMQDLNRMEESLNSTVQCEENKEIVEASVALMKRRHRELEVGLESLLAKMWGVELNWREELECRLSEIGEIKLIAAPTLKHEKVTKDDSNPSSVLNPPPDRPFGTAKVEPVVKKIPPKYIEVVESMFSYKAQKEDELNFTEGRTIYVLKKNPDGWYEGVLDGVRGLFPFNYVKAKPAD